MIFRQNLFLIIITLFLRNSVSFSQDNTWKHFDKANSGLPTNTIRCVTQDSRGIYWIATWDSGLVKYDGKKWTVFNTQNSGLPNNCVYSITFDKKGKLYIGTMGGGLAIFDGKSKWKIYDVKNSKIPENWIYSVALDKKSNIWVGTFSEGLGVFDGKQWKAYNKTNSILLDNKVTYIDIDKFDNKILATQRELVFIIDDEWKSESDMKIDSLDYIAYWISTTADGKKLISYKYGGGIVLFDGKNFQSFKKNNSTIPIEGFYSAVEDKKKIIYAGSFGEGVVSFDGIKWTLWDKSNSPLKDNLIFNIYVDSKNNKWFSTYFGGLSIYNEDGIKF
jgi:ligand-binding sensor domain-containing protein